MLSLTRCLAQRSVVPPFLPCNKESKKLKKLSKFRTKARGLGQGGKKKKMDARNERSGEMKKSEWQEAS